MARWSAARRALLAQGGHFQLLEALNLEDGEGRLEGLRLSGRLLAQRRQLADHLQGARPIPDGHGWLAPDLQTRRAPRLYGARDLVWLYGAQEVESAEGLHPAVARCLLAQYLPQPGVVADPMAGGGAVARAATQLGHVAWASDRFPARPFIRAVNLLTQDLADVLEGSAHPHVDLPLLHPPLPASLDLPGEGYAPGEEGYAAWLNQILENTVHALRAGGFLVLVLPLGVSPQLLVRVEAQLEVSLSEQFWTSGPALRARHLAAARSGREGWHLLVAQSPVWAEEEG